LVDDTEGTGQRISFGLAKLMRDLLRLILDIVEMKKKPTLPKPLPTLSTIFYIDLLIQRPNWTFLNSIPLVVHL
jgi:hypothetical protein